MEEKDIGAIIRKARTDMHYTQAQVGVLLGYTGESAEVSVRRWESNARPVPLEKLRKLAEVLHLKLDDLIP